MRRYYGIDLADVWRPGGGPHGLTPRRLETLLHHLPDVSDPPTLKGEQ